MRSVIIIALSGVLLASVDSALGARHRYRDTTGDHDYSTAGNWDAYPASGWADVLNGAPGVGANVNSVETDSNILSVGYDGVGDLFINDGGRLRPKRAIVGADDSVPGVGIIAISGSGRLITRSGDGLNLPGNYGTFPGLQIGTNWGTAGAGGTGSVHLLSGDSVLKVNNNKDIVMGIDDGTGPGATGTLTLDDGSM